MGVLVVLAGLAVLGLALGWGPKGRHEPAPEMWCAVLCGVGATYVLIRSPGQVFWTVMLAIFVGILATVYLRTRLSR